MQISNQQQMDISGIMLVGVVNKRFSNAKLIGSVINYNLSKGAVKVRLYLDANKKKLMIFTPANPMGEVFSDLPKDGLFYPAIQNKSKVMNRNVLKVEYKFEMQVPKEKREIGNMGETEESGEENDEGEEEENNTEDDININM